MLLIRPLFALCSMMEIGNFCKDGAGENPLCEREERAHMGLWCMMSSPLVLGFNMSSKADMDRVWPTITNREVDAQGSLQLL